VPPGELRQVLDGQPTFGGEQVALRHGAQVDGVHGGFLLGGPVQGVEQARR
jgi:hypothetical protein